MGRSMQPVTTKIAGVPIDVLTLTLMPGDALVVRHPANLSAAAHHEMCRALREFGGMINVPFLVMPNDTELTQLDEQAMRLVGWERVPPPDAVVAPAGGGRRHGA